MVDLNSNIVRKIKLSKFGSYLIKDNEKELFDFIEHNLMGLKSVELKRYPDYIMFFNNENENVFQYNILLNTLYVNTDLIWKILYRKFQYNADEIDLLISNIVKQAYKLNDVVFTIVMRDVPFQVKQAYKFNKRKYINFKDERHRLKYSKKNKNV